MILMNRWCIFAMTTIAQLHYSSETSLPKVNITVCMLRHHFDIREQRYWTIGKVVHLHPDPPARRSHVVPREFIPGDMYPDEFYIGYLLKSSHTVLQDRFLLLSYLLSQKMHSWDTSTILLRRTVPTKNTRQNSLTMARYKLWTMSCQSVRNDNYHVYWKCRMYVLWSLEEPADAWGFSARNRRPRQKCRSSFLRDFARTTRFESKLPMDLF